MVRSSQQAVIAKPYVDTAPHAAYVPSVRVVDSPKVKPMVLQKWVIVLLLMTLAFVGFQGVRCGISSVIKVEKLVSQLNAIESAHEHALATHNNLNDKISLYSSPSGVEELAREGLELVRKDEVLVRLYPPNKTN